ncbi:hypothetical protein PG988_001489 [Apiospora saccharicola]
MEADSDETVYAILRACKNLFGVYRDLMYERNIRHDNGSAVFKIARNGVVAAFEHLERIAKTMDEGLPGLSRVQFVSSEGGRFIGSSLADRSSCPFTPEFSFTPLHWAAAAGHLGTVQWLLTKGADCNALGKSSAGKFQPGAIIRLFDWGYPAEQTRKPCTPLHVAVCTGNVETSISLLGAGSVLSVNDPTGNLPEILGIAVIYGHVDLIRYVVQSNYASPTSDYLRFAAESPACATSLRCLAELGCDIIEGLDHLISVGEYDNKAIEMLEDPTICLDLSRVNTRCPSTNQATALLMACTNRMKVETESREDFRKLVVLLLESGADVNFHITGSWTKRLCLLECAVTLENDNGFFVEELIKRGAQIWKPCGDRVIARYLQSLDIFTGRHNDLETNRANGSCVAVYKLELLRKHGARVPKNSIHQDFLESMYNLAIWCEDGQVPPRANTISLLRFLVNNGIIREPTDARSTWKYNPHSFLFGALTGCHYDIARIFIERGGTCFDAWESMEDIDRCYNQMPQDIRRWMDTVYFL